MAAKILIINEICNYFMLTLLKDRVINGRYVTKDRVINTSSIPNECNYCSLLDIVSKDAPKSIYISPVGCRGIVRRKEERKININERLEEVLLKIADEMDEEEIEKRSRIQKRGKYSPPMKETIIV